MLKALPEWKPISKDELDNSLTLCGATGAAEKERSLRNLNRQPEEVLGPNSPVINVIELNIEETAHGRDIRRQHPTLRPHMWDGGMSMHRQFCLDFFDTDRQLPVSIPDDSALFLRLGRKSTRWSWRHGS
ncbi:hypothetical protein C2E23DRAFT_625779 [Lenzites betulinus]|nr:hypothetical protein C2E23DRAFT_625779 [Lenzites betulinus]